MAKKLSYELGSYWEIIFLLVMVQDEHKIIYVKQPLTYMSIPDSLGIMVPKKSTVALKPILACFFQL